MKKLMIAAAIVCAAAFAQAATYEWSSSGTVYTWDSSDAAGWPAVAEGTPAYMVFASAYAMEDLVADFNAGNVNSGKLSAVGVGQINAAGGVSTTDGAYDTVANQTAFLIVFDDGKMFISGEKTAAYNAFGAQSVNFGSGEVDDVWTGVNLDAAKGYQGAGWYEAATVPEPTSGLLLLLGVAGLALRRRRA